MPILSTGTLSCPEFREQDAVLETPWSSFTSSDLPILHGGTINPTIHITFNMQNYKPLHELSNYSAHKTLGVHKSPAGQSSAAF